MRRLVPISFVCAATLIASVALAQDRTPNIPNEQLLGMYQVVIESPDFAEACPPELPEGSVSSGMLFIDLREGEPYATLQLGGARYAYTGEVSGAVLFLDPVGRGDALRLMFTPARTFQGLSASIGCPLALRGAPFGTPIPPRSAPTP